MKSEHQFDLPRRLQIEFSGVVQNHTDDAGGEVTPEQMWQIFEAEYLATTGPLQLNAVHTSSAQGERDALRVGMYVDGERQELEGNGNGPIAAFVDALSSVGRDVRVLDYAEHAMSAGGDAKAAAYLECDIDGRVLWGVGVDANILTASLKAVVSALNRVARTS
jgi:2-isopropylmalate synthase